MEEKSVELVDVLPGDIVCVSTQWIVNRKIFVSFSLIFPSEVNEDQVWETLACCYTLVTDDKVKRVLS